MNLILGPAANVPYHADIRRTLGDAGIDPAAYDGYLRELETDRRVPEFKRRDFFVYGIERKRALETPRLQTMWGVFSAFPRGSRRTIPFTPVAPDNGRYWPPPDPAPQVPGACFEIVCFDSSYTLLIGLTEGEAACYRKSHPEATPLSSVWETPAA